MHAVYSEVIPIPPEGEYATVARYAQLVLTVYQRPDARFTATLVVAPKGAPSAFRTVCTVHTDDADPERIRRAIIAHLAKENDHA